MPGQTGSENRIKTISLPTRWSPEGLAHLRSIADATGCTMAEVLRRLVRQADRKVLASREIVVEIRKLGNNINQIARQLNSGSSVSETDLRQAYLDLLKAARALLS